MAPDQPGTSATGGLYPIAKTANLLKDNLVDLLKRLCVFRAEEEFANVQQVI